MKNKKIEKRIWQKIISGVLCTVIAVGSMLISPQFELKAEAAKNHTCVAGPWKTLSKGSGFTDLYQERLCNICEEVVEINYMRSEDFVKDRLYKQIANAKENAVINTYFGPYHVVHDDLFIWLSTRNDVTAVVTYLYQGVYYQTTFPAGVDYTVFLQDDALFYGMPGLDEQYGIVTLIGEGVTGGLLELEETEGAELLYNMIRLCPKQGTVHFDFEDLYTINETLISTLAENNDITVKITYKYKEQDFRTTFPAGADYSELLNDSQKFYGMLGLNGRCGITTELCE